MCTPFSSIISFHAFLHSWLFIAQRLKLIFYELFSFHLEKAFNHMRLCSVLCRKNINIFGVNSDNFLIIHTKQWVGWKTLPINAFRFYWQKLFFQKREQKISTSSAIAKSFFSNALPLIFFSLQEIISLTSTYEVSDWNCLLR